VRNWHRRGGIFVSVFTLLIALSGIALQIEMDFISPARMAQTARTGAPADETPSLEQLITTTLAGVHRQGLGRISYLAIRGTDSPPSAEVMVLEPTPRRLRLNALTGEPLVPGGGGGEGLHRFLLEFHRGTLFGRSGYWLSVACGAVLAFLSISGIVMYVQMLCRRISGGRRKWLW
jgi:uncharacterized iron-regulated membrane protein